MTPTGLQQTAKTPADTAKTDLVVPPVVPLDAKTAELMAIWDQLSEAEQDALLSMARRGSSLPESN